MRGSNAECSTCCISCLGLAHWVSKRNMLENIALHMLLNMIYVVPKSSVVQHSLLNHCNEEEEEEEEDPLYKTSSL